MPNATLTGEKVFLENYQDFGDKILEERGCSNPPCSLVYKKVKENGETTTYFYVIHRCEEKEHTEGTWDAKWKDGVGKVFEKPKPIEFP